MILFCLFWQQLGRFSLSGLSGCSHRTQHVSHGLSITIIVIIISPYPPAASQSSNSIFATSLALPCASSLRSSQIPSRLFDLRFTAEGRGHQRARQEREAHQRIGALSHSLSPSLHLLSLRRMHYYRSFACFGSAALFLDFGAVPSISDRFLSLSIGLVCTCAL